MSSTSVATIRLLVKEISTLSTSFLDSVPKGSKDDKIWSVMNTDELDTPHETFNRRFDAMFGEDCRNSDGHLHYVRQGKLGMGLVVPYLSKINWTTGFPLDLVELKLQHLVTELKSLQYVSDFIIICNCLLKSLGDRMHLDLCATSILLRSSRMQPTLQYPRSPSNAKPSKITIHAQQNFLSQQKVPTTLH
jgi:hypothetical protein